MFTGSGYHNQNLLLDIFGTAELETQQNFQETAALLASRGVDTEMLHDLWQSRERQMRMFQSALHDQDPRQLDQVGSQRLSQLIHQWKADLQVNLASLRHRTDNKQTQSRAQ